MTQTAQTANHSTCPDWCAADKVVPARGILSAMIWHTRLLAVASDLRVQLEWAEDCRPPTDPEYFLDPPVVAIYDDLVGEQIDLRLTPDLPEALFTAAVALKWAQTTPDSDRNHVLSPGGRQVPLSEPATTPEQDPSTEGEQR